MVCLVTGSTAISGSLPQSLYRCAPIRASAEWQMAGGEGRGVSFSSRIIGELDVDIGISGPFFTSVSPLLSIYYQKCLLRCLELCETLTRQFSDRLCLLQRPSLHARCPHELSWRPPYPYICTNTTTPPRAAYQLPATIASPRQVHTAHSTSTLKHP